MKTILNVIWLVLSGFWLFLGYLLAGLLLCITIIGIPFGIAAFRIGVYALWPFGYTTVERRDAGAPSCVGNVLWLVLAGWWLALGHIFTGIALCITIIGIPLRHRQLQADPGLADAAGPRNRPDGPAVRSRWSSARRDKRSAPCRDRSHSSPVRPVLGRPVIHRPRRLSVAARHDERMNETEQLLEQVADRRAQLRGAGRKAACRLPLGSGDDSPGAESHTRLRAAAAARRALHAASATADSARGRRCPADARPTRPSGQPVPRSREDSRSRTGAGPSGVLPIADFGCGMYACVDCRSDTAHGPAVRPECGRAPTSPGTSTAPSLADWLRGLARRHRLVRLGPDGVGQTAAGRECDLDRRRWPPSSASPDLSRAPHRRRPPRPAPARAAPATTDATAAARTPAPHSRAARPPAPPAPPDAEPSVQADALAIA